MIDLEPQHLTLASWLTLTHTFSCRIGSNFKLSTLARRHPLLQGEYLLQKEAQRKASKRATGGAARRRLSNRKADADGGGQLLGASDSDDEDQVRLYCQNAVVHTSERRPASGCFRGSLQQATRRLNPAQTCL